MIKKTLQTQIEHYITIILLTLFTFAVQSCSEEIISDDANQISFETSVQDDVNLTRATIFENQNDILNDAPYDKGGKGGGNLTMHAYTTNTGEERIHGSRAWYFNDVWRFYDASSNKFYNHYWPNTSMDFFAYMPWKGSGRLQNITVVEYKVGTGLTLSCSMQSTTADDKADTDDLLDPLGQETIIAYTPNKHREVVNLHFVHPFAAVSFELKQAHRNLTINWIRFNNVYLTGSTTLNATTEDNTQISWAPTGNTATFTIPINKTIPDEINFGAKIGGPYLVMPQLFGKGTDSKDDDLSIIINYTWDDAKDTDTSNDTYEITRSLSGEWLAGNKYKYILNLGDNKEEILFKVEVEPWIATGGNNNIFDVE